MHIRPTIRVAASVAVSLLTIAAQGAPVRQTRPAPRPRVSRVFRAPALLSASPSAPSTLNLLRQMLIAQNNLTLMGTLVTETPQGSFIQHAVINGARAQRYECLNPPRYRGEIIVDNGRFRYHALTNGKVEIQESQANNRRVIVPQIIGSIRQGNLLAQVVGQGVVAGHVCTIVRVGPPYAADWNQYWIDPTNGAQLRIEQYSAAGNRLSASYFTNVTYNPPLEKGLFAPLHQANMTVPPHPRSPRQATVPSSDQAGFTVLQPTYLPPGFQFQSATVADRAGKKLVRLTYGNGLNALSLFETPDTNKEGPNAALIRSPRPGVVTTRRAGLAIILVSSVSAVELETVLNSIH